MRKVGYDKQTDKRAPPAKWKLAKKTGGPAKTHPKRGARREGKEPTWEPPFFDEGGLRAKATPAPVYLQRFALLPF